MKNFLTKRNALLLAFFGSLVFVLSAFQKELSICGTVYNNCWDIVDLIWPPLSFSIPLLFLCILTHKMRDEIFVVWINFAKWWVPLSMIAILITPQEIKGSFSVPIKEPLAFFCAGTLLVVSLILIAHKHLTLKKGGAGK